MSEYSTLIAGKVDDWKEIIDLFEENDEDYDDEDFTKPICLAGEILGFGHFDHDKVDYLESEKPLELERFFELEDVQRISDWDLDLNIVKNECIRQGLTELSFIHRFGEEHYKNLEVGKQVKHKNGFLHFLGYFDEHGVKTI